MVQTIELIIEPGRRHGDMAPDWYWAVFFDDELQEEDYCTSQKGATDAAVEALQRLTNVADESAVGGEKPFLQRVKEYMKRMDRNGCFVDEDAICEFGSPLSVDDCVNIITRWAAEEVLNHIGDNTVPANVASFSQLHDHVDANGYGGAFEIGFDSGDECVSFWNRVQNNLDRWIKSGRPEIDSWEGWDWKNNLESVRLLGTPVSAVC